MLLEGENEFLVSEIFTQRPGVDNEDNLLLSIVKTALCSGQLTI